MQDVLEIQVVPLSSACGAEIRGVDLTKPLSRETVEAIRDAWNKHLVLVFRGQTISQDQQLAFASYFGDLGSRKKAPEQAARPRRRHPAGSREGAAGQQHQGRNGVPIGAFGEGEFWFHIDSGYSAKPYQYTFLYALELPSTGGNTMFSNMYKAYDAVPEELKREAQRQARAAHPRIQPRAAGGCLRATSATSRTTIIRCSSRIPYTGRKTLFVDRLMTTALEGFDPAEGAAILDQLYDIGERREFIYEHVWQLGDFLMWDNRCTIHARTDFPKEERRLLRRCTVEGDPMRE